MSWCDIAVVFAERNGVDALASRMADGFRSGHGRLDSGRLAAILLSGAAVVLVVWLLSYFSDGRRRPVAYHSPWKLFLSLGKAHRLTSRELWLLWRLARWHELEDPARLFLEPERFDCRGLSPWLTRRAARLQSLRSRLFAGLAKPDSAVPAASGVPGLPIAMPVAGPIADLARQ
jgi:hypothetical protein